MLQQWMLLLLLKKKLLLLMLLLLQPTEEGMILLLPLLLAHLGSTHHEGPPSYGRQHSPTRPPHDVATTLFFAREGIPANDPGSGVIAPSPGQDPSPERHRRGMPVPQTTRQPAHNSFRDSPAIQTRG